MVTILKQQQQPPHVHLHSETSHSMRAGAHLGECAEAHSEELGSLRRHAQGISKDACICQLNSRGSMVGLYIVATQVVYREFGRLPNRDGPWDVPWDVSWYVQWYVPWYIPWYVPWVVPWDVPWYVPCYVPWYVPWYAPWGVPWYGPWYVPGYAPWYVPWYVPWDVPWDAPW